MKMAFHPDPLACREEALQLAMSQSPLRLSAGRCSYGLNVQPTISQRALTGQRQEQRDQRESHPHLLPS